MTTLSDHQAAMEAADAHFMRRFEGTSLLPPMREAFREVARGYLDAYLFALPAEADESPSKAECCARVEREDLPAKVLTNVERTATKDLAQVRLEEGKAIVTVAGVEVRSFCHADRENLALSLALNINRAHQAAAAAQPTEADVERVARSIRLTMRRAGLTVYDQESIMKSLRKAAAGKYELDTGDEWAIGHAADILAPYLVADAKALRALDIPGLTIKGVV